MIIEQTISKTTFDKLDVGDVFTYGGDAYLKAKEWDIEEPRAVRLEDGIIEGLVSYAEVHPIPLAKLVM